MTQCDQLACCHLADVALSAGLHQRHLRGLAQAVHVAPRLDVVQAVQHQAKAAEEVDAEPRVLDVCLQGSHVSP